MKWEGKRMSGGGFCICVKAICSILIIMLVIERNMITYNDELIYPYVFGMLLISIYYEKTRYEMFITVKNLFIYLGKISYTIFLMHYGICYIFLMNKKNNSNWKMASLYLIVVISVAIVMDFGKRWIKKMKFRRIGT